MGLLRPMSMTRSNVGSYEVEAVAEVVVGRYGFKLVVDHHRSPASFWTGECVDRAPVELHGNCRCGRLPDPGLRRPVVMEIVDVVSVPLYVR